MADLNNVIMKGRLVKDAELKYTPSQMAVVGFSLAYNKAWKDASGEWKEQTYYFQCNWFGKTAEKNARNLLKGTPVIVQGALKQEKWQGNDGINHEKISLILDTVDILSDARKGESGDSFTAKKPQNIPEPDHFDDDGIPF